MEYVTITINGITQTVPKADLAQYLRAGYSVVDPKPAPVKPAQKTDPDPAPVQSEAVEAAEKPAPRKSK